MKQKRKALCCFTRERELRGSVDGLVLGELVGSHAVEAAEEPPPPGRLQLGNPLVQDLYSLRKALELVREKLLRLPSRPLREHPLGLLLLDQLAQRLARLAVGSFARVHCGGGGEGRAEGRARQKGRGREDEREGRLPWFWRRIRCCF